MWAGWIVTIVGIGGVAALSFVVLGIVRQVSAWFRVGRTAKGRALVIARENAVAGRAVLTYCLFAHGHVYTQHRSVSIAHAPAPGELLAVRYPESDPGACWPAPVRRRLL